MPGTSVMIAGRSSNRAYQLLATPTVNAPRKTPISGPKNLTPRRLPPTASAPAINIHTASRNWARSRMVKAIGIVTSASASVHAGKGAGRAMAGSPSNKLAIAPPAATPKPMLRKSSLLILPPERGEDRSRRRKKLPLKSEPFGGLLHDFFKAVSGNAVNMQRATESQHEANGVARSDV